MYRRLIVGVVLVFCLAVVGSVAAQTNGPLAPQGVAATTKFTYQGQINRNGTLFTGTCDMRFTLWDAAVAGTQQGATYTPPASVPVSNGVFAIELDFGNQFKGEARWLQTEAKCADDADYTALPRQPLTAVPYAISLLPGAVIDGTGPLGLTVNTPNGNALVAYGQKNGFATIYGNDGSSTGGYGVYGTTTKGSGVAGFATGSGTGVFGNAQTGSAVYGTSASGTGVRGISTSWVGVWGQSDTSSGVHGQSTAWVGVWGQSTTSSGVHGQSTNGAGVYAKSTNWDGVHVESAGAQGVYVGTAAQDGVRVDGAGIDGVYANGGAGNSGVFGNNFNDNSIGVKGRADSAGSVGVWGESLNNTGVYGQSANGIGVWAASTSPTQGALYARNTGGGPAAYIDGRASVSVIEIRGGADLAERFNVGGDKAEPGTLMVIDPQHPGQLTISRSAYDTKVAGIVSGAGDVKPGLTLHQQGVLEGNTEVAIAGRVYVKSIGSNGSIEPGDLLTTSDQPGYAMKATDPDRSHGAVIGKAMTGLKAGTGLVLVLVNLQ